MKKVLRVTVFVLLVACSMQFSSTVSAVSKPKATVKLKNVDLGQVKVSTDEDNIYFSVKVKNNSKNTARKIKASYEVVLEGTSLVCIPVETTKEVMSEETTEVVTTESETMKDAQEETTLAFTESTKENEVKQTEVAGVELTKAAEVESTEKYVTSSVVEKKTITVTLKTGKVKGKKTAYLKAVVKNPFSNNVVKVVSTTLNKKKVYSSTGVWIYDKKSKKKTLAWGVRDKKAPVIKGLVKDKSYQGDDCYITIFSDKKNFKFSKYIKATDNRDGKVKIFVNTKKVKWKKRGNYKVRITAKDKAGNVAKSWVKIHVEPKGMLSEMADDILKKIVKKSWSDEKKCRAIYTYVQGHISYIDSNVRVSWQTAAEQSVKYGYGNCFNYYAMSKLLISRCGIPNLEITRYPAAYGNHHWWNLVYVKGGWYHFDTTPRIRRGYLCLLTNAQLQEYCWRTGSTFYYKESLYPKRAEKRL